MRSPVAFVLKGYPRLSETFIAQEIHGLEARGLDIRIVSLRHPTDRVQHPVHGQIRAPLLYLPEYLLHEPWRSLKGWWRARRLAGYAQARRLWLADLRRDRTVNRVRRFGQALVLAAELPAEVGRLHSHFLHTPGSVARYAAVLLGLPWSGSAHAKDIWLLPDWEVREKLAAIEWLVTCNGYGLARLEALAPQPDRVRLLYHGLDFGRFAAPPPRRPGPNGCDPGRPVALLAVGRAVPKKGLDDLLAALALLPPGLAWRLTHVGGGPLAGALRKQARTLGLADRIEWLGAQPQEEVLRRYRAADLFVLASRIAADGDRDGLPNVLLEAQSQRLAVVATAVAAVPELVADGETGLLARPGTPPALAAALARLIADPVLRLRLGEAGFARVRRDFDQASGLDWLAARLGPPAPAASRCA
jgi:glycosyltransferase involved in cell wall biosynthesis